MTVAAQDSGAAAVRRDDLDGVAWLRLNRPERHNALRPQDWIAFADILEAVAVDPSVGAVVVTGVGRAFCSGGDLGPPSEKATPAPSSASLVDLVNTTQRPVLLLHTMPKPTISAINGPAAGAGLGLALCCDLRFIARSARLISGFLAVGLPGDFGGTWFATQLAGGGVARDLFLLGEPVGAERAERFGLVTEVVDDDALADRVSQVAGRLAAGPPRAIEWLKRSLIRAPGSDLPTLLHIEAQQQAAAMQTEECREGVRAFRERRAPRFQRR